MQETWINNPQFGVARDEVDPILGAMPKSAERRFKIQQSPISKRVCLKESFQVKGGGYFTLPGKRSLRYLANMGTAIDHAKHSLGPSADRQA